jgi:NADH:ubiquinone oxidoreductase subunit
MIVKFLSSFLGSKSPAFIWFVTKFQGMQVGIDVAGNRYFTGSPRKGYKNERRWVMYKDAPDSSTVPPEWHSWLHYQTDTRPTSDGVTYRKAWQKKPLPNMTGTQAAYHPQGKDGARAKATGDYHAWTPDSH